MSRTHRKTPKGHAEIDTRARRLTTRMRSVLILVDGRRSDQEIVRLLGPDSADLLVELAWQNYIERVDQASAVDSRVPPRSKRSRPPAVVLPATTEGAAFADLRQRASRRLTDQLGPFAQLLAQRMEQSQTAHDLEPLLDKATSLISQMLGAEAASRFRGELTKR
jgi:hypothetical protein